MTIAAFDVSLLISLSHVRASWQEFRDGQPRSEEQFLHCKRITLEYIEASPDRPAAQRAVLDLARRTNFFRPVPNVDTTERAVLKHWLSTGLDINQKNSGGRTILLQICQKPDHALYTKRVMDLSLLIEHGANVHSTDPCTGHGALHLVMDSMTEWLSPGPNPVHGDGEEMLVILLKAGCDPDARNFDGQTPLELAQVNGSRSGELMAGDVGLALAAWHRAMARRSPLLLTAGSIYTEFGIERSSQKKRAPPWSLVNNTIC
jgi:hypothetical protein